MFSQFWFTNFASGMKLKLKTLSIAIAAGTLSLSAQADLKIGGDIGVGYFQSSSGDNEVKEAGSEINFDAPEKVGGTTFYGHVEVDMAGTGNTAEFEEIRVGAKGAWGEVRLGEADNGCDWLDVGGYPDKFMAPIQGSCGSDVNNLVYKRSMGAATVAVSHNPNGDKYNAIGVQAKIGPVKASLGYEVGGVLGANDKNVAVGLSGSFGPVSLGLRANKADGYSHADIGVNAAYSAGGNKFYVGFGNDENDVDGWGAGYNRSIGKKSTFVIEARDSDTQAEMEYGIGLIHVF